MKNFKAVALTLFFLGSTAMGADTECGLVNQSASVLPGSAKLWVAGAQVLYEYSGGVSLTGSETAPLDRFSQSGERILSVQDWDSGKFLLFTRQARGFAVYQWDNSALAGSRLTPMQSRRLDFSDAGRTYSSPLVDLTADATNFYLLSNFHLTTLKKQDLRNNVYSPTTDRIPGCSGSVSSCWRAVGLFKWGQDLAIAQMIRTSTRQVRFSYSKRSSGWANISAPYDLGKADYVNLLPQNVAGNGQQGSLLAVHSDFGYALRGANASMRLDVQGDFATAMSSATPLNGGFLGAVSFQKLGSYFYKDGVAKCKCFEAMRSVAVVAEASRYRVYGIDRRGNVFNTVVGP